MSPLIFATALSILAPVVTGVTAPGHHKMNFDDTRTDIIDNGGDPNEVLCADRPIVGSRFIRHICYTRGQWAELKGIQHYHTDRMMRSIGENAGIPGDPTNPLGADNPP